MKSKKLLYVTLAYPGDLYSEKVFVDSELPALRREFEEIILVPTDPFPRCSDYERNLPDGVIADWSLASDIVYSSKILKLPYIFHPDVIRSIWRMRREAHSPRQWLKGLFQAINMVRSSFIFRRVARYHGMTPKNTVLYSMWFADPASGLARLANRNGWKMATRAHTSDLYDNRMLFRSHSLRAQLLSAISYVFTISAKGAEYMKERYPDAAECILFHPLGALRTGPADASRLPFADGSISFVTTARLDPVKSLPLIMDTLAEIAKLLPDRHIRWTIFGDGLCMNALRNQAEQLNIPNFTVEFKGALPNPRIQEYYAEQRPDWFIMMSRSEGLPISMGEAMAHAIPIITTDVGDVSELTGPDSAILLPPPFDREGNPTLSPAEYARLLAPKISDSELQKALSQAALSRWQSHFDAASLASKTASILAYIPARY